MLSGSAREAPSWSDIQPCESPLPNRLPSAADVNDRPLIDSTGLKGNYDFKLEFMPERMLQNNDGSINPAAAPPILTALPQQLGLKLESAKHAYPVLPAAFRRPRACMSVHPLVYQQPQQCFCALIYAAGWPNGPGRGSTNQFHQRL
jgi:hypothetical protein